ncbi:Phosphomevalonate kinase, peroxisomal-like protein [Drosera capensis]
MEVVASAPGKVLITGGYLILERPNSGLVLSTSSRFYAIIKPFHDDIKAESWAWAWMDFKLSSPQLSREIVYKIESKNPFVEQAVQYAVAAAFAKVGKDVLEKVLLKGDCGVYYSSLSKRCLNAGTYCSQLGFKPAGLHITVLGDNDFYSYRSQLEARGLPLTPESLSILPAFTSITFNADDANGSNKKPEVAKTGLGSSAAMTTAVVASLLHYLGVIKLPLSSDNHLQGRNTSSNLELVHIVAQTAHYIAQGKVGSGFDVSSAVYGSQRYVRFSPDVISSAQVARNGLPLQDIIVDVLNGKWDHERSSFSLPPLMSLLLGEPGSGGSSTPSMVGAVKKWQKSEPEKSLQIWKQLTHANSLLEKQINMLKKWAHEHWDAYRSIVNGCSTIKAEKWLNLAVGPSEHAVVEALLGARDAMLQIRSYMQQMGKAAGVPIEPETQTELLNATMDLDGVLLAGVPGAGGFDAVFAVVLGNSSSKIVAEWSSCNVLALLVREDPRGVRLENGDPRVEGVISGISASHM